MGRKILMLAAFDVKYIFRDFMLIVSLVAPMLLALIVRFIIPFVDPYLYDSFSIHLFTYEPLIILFVIMTVPVMIGILTAFILLDEQDEGILLSIAVTPLSRKGYLFYRLSTPILMCTIWSIIALSVAGYISWLSWKVLLVIVFMSFLTPFVTLLIAGIAKNKVEGLAVAKVVSILLLVPMLVYFVKGPMVYIGSFLPPFWLSLAFFNAITGGTNLFFMALFISLFTHIIAIYMLYQRYNRVVL